MVVLSNTPSFDHLIPSIKSCNKPTTFFTDVPIIDLAKPSDFNKNLIVKACEEFGFFKVTNHGVPLELITNMETETLKFFSLPQSLKEKSVPPNPFGYGNRKIGLNGDEGWIEYLLLRSNSISLLSDHQRPLNSTFKETPEVFCSAINDYIFAVKNLASEVLELLAKGLEIEQKNVFSKLLMAEESDCVFRLNHYPPFPENQVLNGENLIGFGAHTDPQMISVLRSNNVAGLQICLRDGSWVSVPPDETSFFINVGDSLQVMSNGRFRSARHRVLANNLKSRISMIFFAGPPMREIISPLPSLMREGEESLYKEFTWCEYRKAASESRLADNRLAKFQIMKAAATADV